ncbi:MAG: sulfatase [Candidatus Coatesbacteria bacterium]|nr:MAG: sulfatase [Candidatus Coatesbacteria bacterium]
MLLYSASALLGAAAEVAFHVETNLDVLREPRWFLVAVLGIAAFVVYLLINLILAAAFSVIPFLRSLEARAVTVAASALAIPHFAYLVTVYAPFPPAGRGALYVFVVVVTPLASAALIHVLRHPPVKRAAAVFFACLLIVALGFFLAPRFLNFGKPERPNVVLITLDAVRPDYLAAYGYSTPKQPYIKALGIGGLVIEGATCEIPASGPSHATIMTSLGAPDHGIIFNRTPLNADFPTLAEAFKSEGYATAAFVGGSPLWASDSGLDHGFDWYDDATHPADAYIRTPLIGRHLAPRLGILETDDNQLERPADEVTDAVIHWLASRRDGPFFLWVNYFDAHDDYLPHAAFSLEGLTDRETQMRINKEWALESTPSAKLEEQITGLYEGEIAFIDSELRRLITLLEKQRVLENTIICIAGVYGESLGEHGNKYHGFNVYREDVHVPLVFYDGGADLPPLRISVTFPVSTIDVAPSLLDLAGVSIPDEMRGRSVFADGPDRVYGFSAAIPDPTRVPDVSEGGVYTVYSADVKLVRRFSEGVPKTELYDLSEDPDEEHNLADEPPERAAEMDAVLDEYIKSFPDFETNLER